MGQWNKKIKILLWQVEWPQDIQYALVSDENPQGHITINDLELRGLLLNFPARDGTHTHMKLEYIGTF